MWAGVVVQVWVQMGVPVRDVAVALQTWGVIRAYRPQPGCLPVSLQKRMQQIMAHCFLAAKSKLECKLGYFDLIGCDFLIDDNFKVLSWGTGAREADARRQGPSAHPNHTGRPQADSAVSPHPACMQPWGWMYPRGSPPMQLGRTCTPSSGQPLRPELQTLRVSVDKQGSEATERKQSPRATWPNKDQGLCPVGPVGSGWGGSDWRLVQVWLLEMNSNPALHTNCEVLKEVIPGVVIETLGEPSEPPPHTPTACPVLNAHPPSSQVQTPQMGLFHLLCGSAAPPPPSPHLSPSPTPHTLPAPPAPPSASLCPPLTPSPPPAPDLALETFQKSLRGQKMLPLLSQRRFVLLHNGEADVWPRLGAPAASAAGCLRPPARPSPPGHPHRVPQTSRARRPAPPPLALQRPQLPGPSPDPDSAHDGQPQAPGKEPSGTGDRHPEQEPSLGTAKEERKEPENTRP